MALVGLSNHSVLSLQNVLLIEDFEDGVRVTYGDADELELAASDALAVIRRVEILEEKGIKTFIPFNHKFLNFKKSVLFEDGGTNCIVTFDSGQQLKFTGIDADDLLEVVQRLLDQSDNLFKKISASPNN